LEKKTKPRGERDDEALNRWEHRSCKKKHALRDGENKRVEGKARFNETRRL